MSKKLTECKTCGKEIATESKTCPNCGAKNSKPFYKKTWFIIICVVLVVGIIGATTDSAPQNSNQPEATSTVSKEPAIEYVEVTVDDMLTILDTNALKAESLFNNAYVEVTGTLKIIDSDGKYISLFPMHDDWAIMGVSCYVTDKTQLEQILEMQTGDTVTLCGKITQVGEILSYSLDIHTIK